MIRNFIIILSVLSSFIFYSLVMYEGGRQAGFIEAAAIYEALKND